MAVRLLRSRRFGGLVCSCAVFVLACTLTAWAEDPDPGGHVQGAITTLDADIVQAFSTLFNWMTTVKGWIYYGVHTIVGMFQYLYDLCWDCVNLIVTYIHAVVSSVTGAMGALGRLLMQVPRFWCWLALFLFLKVCQWVVALFLMLATPFDGLFSGMVVPVPEGASQYLRWIGHFVPIGGIVAWFTFVISATGFACVVGVLLRKCGLWRA